MSASVLETALADWVGEAVEHDASLDRVLALPRRPPLSEFTPEVESWLASLDPRDRGKAAKACRNDRACVDPYLEALSESLRCREWGRDPNTGEPRRNVLRPAQGTALREVMECRGLFAPMKVGSGKTLVTFLAPTVLNSVRPVLVVPAKLRAKTKREFAAYREDWRCRLPKVISYQTISHPDHTETLRRERPDLLELDEVHKARRTSATKSRIAEVIRDFEPAVVALSGTLITANMLDYWDALLWTLRDRAPVPLQLEIAKRWAQALDRDIDGMNRIGLGALTAFPDGFHEWMRASRGVIPTPASSDDYTGSIQLSTWSPEIPPELRAVIDQVVATRKRPDGEDLDDWDLPDCLCQLAQGFYYVWDPLPPDWWLRPRRGWMAYVRATLDEHAKDPIALAGLDSTEQIVRALESANPRTVPPAAAEGRQLLAEWRAVRDQFEPNTVPIWLDVAPLLSAIKRAKTLGDGVGGCLIWTRHVAAGVMLEYLGVPYYGGGTDPEPSDPKTTIAVSIQAHGEGKNLQTRHRMLVLTPMANADGWEQVIGREARAMQESDTVYVETIDAVPYHLDVLERVLAESRRASEAAGFVYKIIAADRV